MASFGEEIRRERELRGIGLREIADITKINIRFLEALEKNDFKHLPGGQFNKGFVRAYAKHVGLDPEKTVNSYLHELNTQEEHERARMKFTPPKKVKKAKARSIAVGIVLLLMIIIALVVLGFFWARYDPDGFLGRILSSIFAR